MARSYLKSGSKRLTGGVFIYLLPLLAADCSHRADDCHYTLTCGDFPSVDSGATGGATGSGGGGGSTTTGGTASSTNTTSSAVGGDPATGGSLGIGGVLFETGGVVSTGGMPTSGGAPTCAPACDGDTPVCLLDSLKCVQCNGEDHCASVTGKPHCDTNKQTCVECTTESQCDSVPGRPHCDTGKNVCLQCMADNQCPDKALSPYCDLANHVCVACLDHEDCKSPYAPVCSGGQCKPCATNDDCWQEGARICTTQLEPDAGVESNVCVECTGTQYTACSNGDAGPSYVCDSARHVCTDVEEHSASVCQPCVSDAECQTGQFCVEQMFGGESVGHFCLTQRNPLGVSDCAAPSNYPFVQPIHTTSIDGKSGYFCSLERSTCTAYNQFRVTPCGSDKSPPDDRLCGFAPGLDSKCGQIGTSSYLCTMACATDIDCKTGFKCNTEGMCKLFQG